MEIVKRCATFIVEKIHGLLHFFHVLWLGIRWFALFYPLFCKLCGHFIMFLACCCGNDPCTCLIRLNKGFSNHLGINFKLLES